MSSVRDRSRTPPKHYNYSFSDLPMNNYMTITVTFFFGSGLLELGYNYNCSFYSPEITIDSILVRGVLDHGINASLFVPVGRSKH